MGENDGRKPGFESHSLLILFYGANIYIRIISVCKLYIWILVPAPWRQKLHTDFDPYVIICM